MALKFRPTPTQEALLEAFRYDPVTGTLAKPDGTWVGYKRRTCVFVYWPRDPHKGFCAHRLIWKMMTGFDPAGDLDHINGDPLDNRWSNLREATRSENCRNRRVTKLTGASYIRGRWQARIQHGGRFQHIGMFATPEEAHEAYMDRAREVYGPFFRAA